AQAHAVMAKNGVLPCRGDMWGIGGGGPPPPPPPPDPPENRLRGLRGRIPPCRRGGGGGGAGSPTPVPPPSRAPRRGGPSPLVRGVYGVGRVFAAVFVAEIGDVNRFRSAEALCSWAGLTPLHRESDTNTRGRITKMACGGASLTARFCIPSGGDRGNRGRSRH